MEDGIMRSKKEVKKAEEMYYELIWLDRSETIEEGEKEGDEEIEEIDSEVDSDITEQMLVNRERIKKKYPGMLGPYSDFDWGMLAGKLSALRWVLGDNWDNLDT